MAAKKQTKKERLEELARLQAEVDAMPDEDEDEEPTEDEDEGDDHIIVFRGKKGLEAFLSQFGDAEDEEIEDEEENPEEDDPSDGAANDGEEESENLPPATKAKPKTKAPVAPKKDPAPERKSRWFAERK